MYWFSHYRNYLCVIKIFTFQPIHFKVLFNDESFSLKYTYIHFQNVQHLFIIILTLHYHFFNTASTQTLSFSDIKKTNMLF